jgi:arylsulfatase K
MINRREFLQAGAAVAMPAGPLKRGSGQRPNIVLIETDSWDGRVLGCTGHAAMKRATPHIDALARAGVLFRNAYCSHPICCPSRANMWSGRYTHHVQSWNNYKGLSAGDPTFKTYLEAAGYTFGTADGGFGKHDYLSGGHTVFNRVVDWTGPANIKLPQFHMPAPSVDAREHTADWSSVDKAKAFLRDAHKTGRPFFMYLGVVVPHPPFATSNKWLDLVDTGAITLPPEDRELHPVMAYQRISKNWEHGFAEDVVRKVRTVYYAMCAEADAMVGAVRKELEQLGLSENTYFIVTSDHGENNMEHRQYYKMNMYESSVRVPLVVAGPGVKKSVSVENIVSLIDLFPTLLDMGRAPHPAGLDGESLMPLLEGKSTRSRNWAYAMYSGCSSNTTMFMLRKGEWKYVEYPGYASQLFHLREDPDEVTNLAAARGDMVKRMAADLRQIVDCNKVHNQVIAYDKASFRAWREEVRRKPVALRESGIDNPAATYDDVMADCYGGWRAEHEATLQHWLES